MRCGERLFVHYGEVDFAKQWIKDKHFGYGRVYVKAAYHIAGYYLTFFYDPYKDQIPVVIP